MEKIKRYAERLPRILATFGLALLSFSVKLTMTLLLFAVPGVFFLRELAWWNAFPLVLATIIVFYFLNRPLTRWRNKRRVEKDPNAQKRYRIKLLAIFLVISVPTVGIIWSVSSNLNKFADATGEHRHNIINWHLKTLSEELADALTVWTNEYSGLSEKEKSLLVIRHFELSERQRVLERRETRENITEEEITELENIRSETEKTRRATEKILQKQVRGVLISEEIINPYNINSVFFPPVIFRIEDPPKVLVVSERDNISMTHGGLVIPHTGLKDIEQVEAQVEEQGYSALVVNIGGMATFPNTVTPKSLHSIISTIAHEWVHLYTTFRPLGRLDVRLEGMAMEETVADIIGNEIRDIIWERYYAPYVDTETENDTATSISEDDEGIDFQEEMGKTFERVEEYLERGRIEEAELYMNARRDWFEEHGYYIRKLNQAYFAFHGSYAVNPAYQEAHGGIGSKLAELRERSPSLKEFLEISTSIKTLEELEDILEQHNIAH
ncbi:MAG: hypothetical protein WDZ39_00970 [Candidatus Spechtbacterales bacterium]